MGIFWNYFKDVDFTKIGFRCGLEIHYQLNTEKKLFCHCPAKIVSRNPDAATLRHMRPTLSELGEYDGTALMEFKTKKEVVYLLYKDVMCTYEMDDTPPFLIDRTALDIVIEIAMMLNCHIVDEVHITRKQYLDGSIPTGFQRTAVIGINGYIPYKDRKIGIRHVTVEEDACREVSDKGHRITFKTDRLGIPLVEVITEPDMKTPWEVEEVGWLIGRTLRETGKVRRGIGTVRQDVNVSIDGGTRVEIKGVPRIGMFAPLTAIEALRQKSLLELRDELIRRGFTYDNMKFDVIDVDDRIKELTCDLLFSPSKENIRFKMIIANGWRGLLGHKTQPGRYFLHEISERIRVIACLDKTPNYISPEFITSYSPDEAQWKRFLTNYNIDKRDGIIIIIGRNEDIKTAVEEAIIRMREAVRGIPNETRQAMPDGTTGFERILPGPDRMYPDTDHPPIPIEEEHIVKIRSIISERPWERAERYKKLGLSDHIINELLDSEYKNTFDRIAVDVVVNHTLIAKTLIEDIKWVRRLGYDIKKLTDERLLEIFRAYEKGLFPKDIMPSVLILAIQDDKSIEEILVEKDIKMIDEKVIKDVVYEVITSNNTEKIKKDSNNYFHFLMGKAVMKLFGKAEGSKIAGIMNELLTSVFKQQSQV
ncbi:MAG: Glu-tRNA(Gln) amidotransferase subunit GatE [bacterium]